MRILTILLAGTASLAAQGQVSPRELIEAGHWKRARAYIEAHPGSDAETTMVGKSTLGSSLTGRFA